VDFTSRVVYHVLHSSDEPNPDAARPWNTKLPTKVKFFGGFYTMGVLTPELIFSTKTFAPLRIPFVNIVLELLKLMTTFL
jgi:hypothetical protein